MGLGEDELWGGLLESGREREDLFGGRVPFAALKGGRAAYQQGDQAFAKFQRALRVFGGVQGLLELNLGFEVQLLQPVVEDGRLERLSHTRGRVQSGSNEGKTGRQRQERN